MARKHLLLLVFSGACAHAPTAFDVSHGSRAGLRAYTVNELTIEVPAHWTLRGDGSKLSLASKGGGILTAELMPDVRSVVDCVVDTEHLRKRIELDLTDVPREVPFQGYEATMFAVRENDRESFIYAVCLPSSGYIVRVSVPSLQRQLGRQLNQALREGGHVDEEAATTTAQAPTGEAPLGLDLGSGSEQTGMDLNAL